MPMFRLIKNYFAAKLCLRNTDQTTTQILIHYYFVKALWVNGQRGMDENEVH